MSNGWRKRDSNELQCPLQAHAMLLYWCGGMSRAKIILNAKPYLHGTAGDAWRRARRAESNNNIERHKAEQTKQTENKMSKNGGVKIYWFWSFG